MISGKRLDLTKLYREVCLRGGLERVIKEKVRSEEEEYNDNVVKYYLITL